MSLAELSSEYSIVKLIISDWIKDIKEIKVDENEILHRRRALAQKAIAIFATIN